MDRSIRQRTGTQTRVHFGGPTLLGFAFVLLFLAVLPATRPSQAAEVPRPESRLGFKPGADFHLAAWPDVVAYFRAVDDASDRVAVRTLGETTEGRPYIAAVISSSDTISNLDKYKDFQAKLHDPRKLGSADEAERAVAESKAVVVITASIHSTETASTMMTMELLHELATGEDARTREILDKTILILVPSANPDGVDKVAKWYERSKGHPWEGSGLPELYHKYAGHDTNRDWFMLNLKETQLLSKLLYTEWFPTWHYDVHQMGGRGARLFVPPFFDPINPNLDPRMNQSIAMIGAHMASDLADEGKRGVLTHAMYDNWWNGGNRTTPQRHNIVAVLTEAASVKLASPIFIEKEQLAGQTRGFTEHKPAVNFVDPWPGGWCRHTDIIETYLTSSRSLQTNSASNRERFQSNLMAMAKTSIDKGKSDPPFAWVVPSGQRDDGTAAEMVRILHDTGIEVHKAKSAITAGAAEYPAGSWVLYAAQPYRNHLKDMMESQVYPTRLTAGGKAETPYDVAGWTLPLQMGVRAVEVRTAFEGETERVDRVEKSAGQILAATGESDGHSTRDPRSPAGNGSKRTEPRPVYRFPAKSPANDDFIVLRALQEAGIRVSSVSPHMTGGRGGSDLVTRWFEVPRSERVKEILDSVLPKFSTRVQEDVSYLEQDTGALPEKRLAVYQPWASSMDEGWTRLVLEKFKLQYTTVHNADIRAGALNDRYDVILLPSIGTRVLRDGYAENDSEPAYVGGIGAEGVAAIRAFLQKGGTLVCLDNSCEFAIDEFDLSVKNVLKGVSTADFYGPGSILRAKVAVNDEVTVGMPEEFSVYFDQSAAFEVPSGSNAKVLVRYAGSHPLESGWLLGPSKLAGKGAIVRAAFGKGSVILFGFPPQHRGQTHGTFRLLFNSLIY